MAIFSEEKADNRWELRIYAATDVKSGKKRWVSRTVTGSPSEAELELASLSELVNYPRRRALDTTMGDLLANWYELASPHWAPNTRRHTRSVIDVHLLSRFRDKQIGRTTTVDIDTFYADLPRWPRGATVERRHRRPDPRCAAPGVDPGGPVGVDLAEPGHRLQGSPGRSARDTLLIPWACYKAINMLQWHSGRSGVLVVSRDRYWPPRPWPSRAAAV